MKTEDKVKEVRFKFDDTRFAEAEFENVEGIVVNPGGYFGKVYIFQIAIANNLNPFFAIEADNEQDAIDNLADSRFSHLIDVPEQDCPKFITHADDESTGEYEENDFTQAGNDGHWVDLSNCSLKLAPKGIRYYVEWKPEQDELSAVIDEELECLRDETPT